MKAHLKLLIAENKVEKAIKELLRLSSGPDSPELHQEAVMLSRQYEDYAKAKRMGTSTPAEQRTEMAQITYALLQVVETLPEQPAPPDEARPEPIQIPEKPEPGKKTVWLGITALLGAAILFTVMAVFQDSLGKAGPLGEMFFLLLLGILAGVAFFDFLPGQAEGSGRVLGLQLKFSGPILAGIAVAVGGYFFLQSSAQGPFGFTVSLQRDKALQIPATYPPLESAKLLLRLGDKWEPADVDAQGDADFKGIASDYRNHWVAARLEAPYWSLVADSVKLSGIGQTMYLTPDGSLETISGYVEDFETGQRVENAVVRVQGQETVSGKYGEYTLKLPLDKQLKYQTIRAYHPKYRDYEMSDIPVETKRENLVVLKPK